MRLLPYLVSLVVLIFIANGCATSSTRSIECSPDIIMAQLPKKCGKYDMEYGTIDPNGFLLRFKDKETVYLLDGFSVKGLEGKDVVVAGKYWPQYIGGLLREGESRSESYIIHNLTQVKLVQIYENDNLDKCKLYRWCDSVK